MPDAGRVIARGARWTGLWCLLMALYLLFAGQLSGTEIIAGLPSATVATLFLWLQMRDGRRLAFRAPWGRVILRPLAALIPDAMRVGTALLRALRHRPPGEQGSTARQRFRHGGEGAADAGRRALVTLGVSLAPNGYVLSIPGGEDALLVHRLVPSAPDPDTAWPL